MRLRDATEFGIAVERDGIFDSLGLLIHSHERMLVCFYDAKFIEQLKLNPHISAVVTSPELAELVPSHLALGISSDPVLSFYSLHEHLMKHTSFYREDSLSKIHPTAIVDQGAFISPRNVEIGPRSFVGCGAKVFAGSLIGSDVNISPGVVVGWDGFEPKQVGVKRVIIPHAGGVEIRSGVEILPNTNVQKAVFSGNTLISEETKIDGLVTVGHNVSIGQRCKIACNTCIAGSTTIGNDVWIGPGSVLSSALKIGDESFIVLGSVVMSSIPAGSKVAGNPARIIAKR